MINSVGRALDSKSGKSQNKKRNEGTPFAEQTSRSSRSSDDHVK